tara:strand:+ start:1847 stop:2044 length:198 start_codon:yes stop_codon:yes gene_type:complete
LIEIDLWVVGALVLGTYVGVQLGYKSGVKDGAAGMYDRLYENGTRKHDKVIVELEYEPRNIQKEF